MAIRYPADIADLRRSHGFRSNNLYTTTNPKTLKNGTVSDSPTLVLHLEPVTFGVCPAAGSCAALCLNKAGNTVYLTNKLSRRRKRSHAYQYHRGSFLRLIVADAARYRAKGYVGMRLNGTSDIAWEAEQVSLDPHLISYVSRRYPQFAIFSPGIYTIVEVMRAMGYQMYDYTKRVDRNWEFAAALGYHLTLSWGGRNDDTIFAVAAKHRLNVAAPVYGVKRSQALPETITHGGVTYPVLDGDVTDWRRDDPASRVHIVGLRLKRTPGQTERLARAFCIV